MYDRPFCKQNQPPVSQVLQLQTRPRGGDNQCPNTTMGSSDPHSPPHDRRSLNRTRGSGTSTGDPQNPFACQLEGIRQDLLAKGLSGQASNIVLAAQRTSTQNQYKSCWSKWVGWCDKQQINPIQPSIAKVVDFLSDLFQAGLQHFTLNTYRSAISSTIPQVEACPVGQHPLVCKFMKGVFNSRPPQPKYSGTWDVGLVTRYLEGLPSDSNLTVSVLTKKCAMFLALSASKRQSDLRAIDLRFKKCFPEGVSFQLAALTKTRTATKSMEFFFPSVPHNKRLCPVTSLDSYVDRTSAWQVVGDGPNHQATSPITCYQESTMRRITPGTNALSFCLVCTLIITGSLLYQQCAAASIKGGNKYRSSLRFILIT